MRVSPPQVEAAIGSGGGPIGERERQRACRCRDVQFKKLSFLEFV